MVVQFAFGLIGAPNCTTTQKLAPGPDTTGPRSLAPPSLLTRLRLGQSLSPCYADALSALPVRAARPRSARRNKVTGRGSASRKFPYALTFLPDALAGFFARGVSSTSKPKSDSLRNSERCAPASTSREERIKSNTGSVRATRRCVNCST